MKRLSLCPGILDHPWFGGLCAKRIMKGCALSTLRCAVSKAICLVLQVVSILVHNLVAMACLYAQFFDALACSFSS